MMKDRTLTRTQRRMPLMWALLLDDQELHLMQAKAREEQQLREQLKKHDPLKEGKDATH